MRWFTVLVNPQSVQVDEQVRELKSYDYQAIVDGSTLRYKIKKSKQCPKSDRTWRERGVIHIHYHARNEGSFVKFEPVYYAAQKRSKRHEKQLKLF